MLNLADGVLCHAQFGRSILETRFGTFRHHVIPGGVDDKFFCTDIDQRREHIVFVGRLLPHKGIDQLIMAALADCDVYVCGRVHDPTYFDLLRTLATGKRVHFLTDATDDQIRDLYRSAFAVVLPSTHRDFFGTNYLAPELMGLTLLEGMACGAPAVCARAGAMPEFVTDDVNGYVFDTPYGLAKVLTELRGNAALCSRLGQAGRRMVEETFSAARVGQRLVEVYSTALQTDRVG